MSEASKYTCLQIVVDSLSLFLASAANISFT